MTTNPPMTLAARTTASLATVHKALTDPAELREWLAEFAEVELPHRYEFWGRHTPEGDAPHQRLLHVDDRSLRVQWLLDGEQTTVEIRLTPDDDGTVITLSQSHFDFQDALTGKSIRGVLQTYWSLALANLVDHAEGRQLTPKIDFTNPQLRAEWEIAATPADIFASVTDSETVSHWFGFPIGIEPWLGGRFAMGGLDNDPSPAKYVAFEPDRKLSLDWGDTGVNTWELEGSEGRTRITMVQSGFTGNPPYPAWGGILAGISQLRRLHEVQPFRPIWTQPQPA